MKQYIRFLELEKTFFYQVSTSELYGLVQETPQKETSPFYLRSPYAVVKMYAYRITVNYRETYGMYASNVFFSIMSRLVAYLQNSRTWLTLHRA